MGSRQRLPAQRARQCLAARPAAQRRQDRRAAGMAALEGRPARRLSRGRIAGTLVASARRQDHPRGRQPAAQGRRDLGVREPDREDGPRKPLPDRGAGPGRDARQSGRRRGGVRPGRAGSACPIPAFAALWGLGADVVKPNVHVSTIRDLMRPARRRTAHGAGSSPPSPASTTSAATATARPS